MTPKQLDIEPYLRKLNRFAQKCIRHINTYDLIGGGDYRYSDSDNSWVNIILIILGVILLIFLIIYLIGSSGKKDEDDCSGDKGCLLLGEVKNSKIPYTIHSENVPSNEGGIGYSMTVWLYVQSDNFNKKNHKYKSVLYRGLGKEHNGFNDAQFSVQPGIWLYGNTNRLLIRWDTSNRMHQVQNCAHIPKPCHQGDRCRDNKNQVLYCNTDGNLVAENATMYSMNPYINPPNTLCNQLDKPTDIIWNTSDANLDNEACIDNIPLDRWFQLGIVMHNQAVDLYIDGKLYSTVVLNSLPSNLENADMVLSSDNSPFYSGDNGFFGAINQLRYFNYPLTPHHMENIYYWGPRPNAVDKVSSKSSSNKKNSRKYDSDELGSDNY